MIGITMGLIKLSKNIILVLLIMNEKGKSLIILIERINLLTLILFICNSGKHPYISQRRHTLRQRI